MGTLASTWSMHLSSSGTGLNLRLHVLEWER
jgi:hypothetical protein